MQLIFDSMNSLYKLTRSCEQCSLTVYTDNVYYYVQNTRLIVEIFTRLQDPDLLLLDEPTNHLDLDTIEWLEGYLGKQDVPMVIISHDRAFLDQLCTKIVETDMGVSRTYEGNYSQYVMEKAAWIEAQNAAWEKQQKEIEQTKDLISRLGAGANSGRASSAEKVK